MKFKIIFIFILVNLQESSLLQGHKKSNDELITEFNETSQLFLKHLTPYYIYDYEDNWTNESDKLGNNTNPRSTTSTTSSTQPSSSRSPSKTSRRPPPTTPWRPPFISTTINSSNNKMTTKVHSKEPIVTTYILSETTESMSSESTLWTTQPTQESENETNLEKLNKTIDSIDKNGDKMLLNIADNLKSHLNKNHLNSSKELIDTVNMLAKMQGKSKLMEKNNVENNFIANFSDKMVDTYSDVLNEEQGWKYLNDSDEKIEISSRILEFIQTISFSFGCNKNISKISKIIKPNIAIEAYSLNTNDSIKIKMNESYSGIFLPKGMPQPYPDVGCDPGLAMGAIINKLSDYLAVKLEKYEQINSNIISFSIKNSLVSTRLPDKIGPVTILLKHNKLLEFGDRVYCVFWDFIQKKWSSEGCRYIEIHSNRRLSVCECNHLTNFAALMDVSGRETNTKIKDILTKVCCSLSSLCLIVTIAILTMIRALRNRRNNIICNLCFCLLIVNILVVFGMDSTENNIICTTIASLLLYFILCSFSWMLMEGYHLYQMLVLVFSNIGYLRLIYLYGIGYGIPIIITIIALFTIGFDSLKRTDYYFCWISSPAYPYRVWAVAGPALLAICLNSLLLFLALKEAFSAKVRKKQIYQVDIDDNTLQTIKEKVSQFYSRFKGFISLLVLLGIPWIFFILYIHRFGQYFSYVFIVINGLQGVFIFIFQILLNDKNRSVIRKAYLKNISSHSLFTNSKNSSTLSYSERSQTSDHSKRY